METDVIRLTQDALWLMLMLSGPPILVATIIGLLIAFIQAVTQLQEQTLSFLFKLVAISITIALTAGLMGETLTHFAIRVFEAFPHSG